MPGEEDDVDDIFDEGDSDGELLDADEGPIDQIPDLDAELDGFLNDAAVADFLDDEGRGLAENIAANLTGSVRQPRNKLEAAVDSRHTRAQIYQAMDMDLAPGNERNIEASFKAHMRSLQRRVADAVGQEQRARSFMTINPDKDPVVLKLHDYAKGNQPTLGSHPHDLSLSIPIPPGYEDMAPRAAELLRMTRKQRDAEFKKLIESFKS